MLQDYIVLLDDMILCLNFINSTTKIIIIRVYSTFIVPILVF